LIEKSRCRIRAIDHVDSPINIPVSASTRRILPMTDRTRARALANESITRGDAVGWFERLYAEAERGAGSR